MQDDTSKFELGNDFSWFFNENGVVNEQIVLLAFADTEFSSDFVADRSGGEAESGALLGDFVVEFSSVLGLKSIGLFNSSLVDGCSQFAGFWFSLASADNDVEGENVVDVEFVLIGLLVEGLLVDDDVVAVNKELLKVVREDSFNWVAFKAFDGFSDKSGNVVVFISWLQTIESNLEGLVGSENGISLASFNGFISNNDSVGNKCNISVDVNTEINFGNITLLEDVELLLFIFSVRFEGRVVTADLVYGDAGRESNTFFEFFLIVNSGNGLVDFVVSSLTNIDDLSSGLAESNDFFEDGICDFSGFLVFIEDSWGCEGFLLLFFGVSGLHD